MMLLKGIRFQHKTLSPIQYLYRVTKTATIIITVEVSVESNVKAKKALCMYDGGKIPLFC